MKIKKIVLIFMLLILYSLTCVALLLGSIYCQPFPMQLIDLVTYISLTNLIIFIFILYKLAMNE